MNSTELDQAKELVGVLEQLTALTTRREQLIAALATGAADTGKPQPALTKKPKSPRTNAEILADNAMGHRTPEEQAKIEDEAINIYNANIEPATPSQKKMLFGILGKQFGIKDDANMKAIIVGITAKLHHGEKIESISKDLSKQWAGDVIDFLLKAKAEDLKEWEVPF